MLKSEIHDQAMKHAVAKYLSEEITNFEKELDFLKKKSDDFVEKGLLVYTDERLSYMGRPPKGCCCYDWVDTPKNDAVSILTKRIPRHKALLKTVEDVPYREWEYSPVIKDAVAKAVLPLYEFCFPPFNNLNPEKGILRILKSILTLNEAGKKPTQKEINAYLKENFGLTAQNSEMMTTLNQTWMIRNEKPGYVVTDFGRDVLKAYGVIS